jgi:hypothetical protein
MKPSLPKALLHLEGLVALALSVAVYRHLGASWILFAVLFLAPDLFMLGYLGGTALGARAYDAGHTYIVPVAIAAIAYVTRAPLVLAVCVIWTAHIGFDRLLGYGLKYPTGFKENHLARV